MFGTISDSPLCLGLFRTVLYVWGYFGPKKQNSSLVHCEVHASQLARLLYDSELVFVNHQNCLKHNKSFLSNEKIMIEAHPAYLIYTIIYVN